MSGMIGISDFYDKGSHYDGASKVVYAFKNNVSIFVDELEHGAVRMIPCTVFMENQII